MLALRLLWYSVWQILHRPKAILWLALGTMMAAAIGAALRVSPNESGAVRAAVLAGMLGLPILFAMAGLGWHHHVLLTEPLRLRRVGLGRYIKEGLLVMMVPSSIGIMAAAIFFMLIWWVLPDEPSMGAQILMSAFTFVIGALIGAMMIYISPAIPDVAVNGDVETAPWWRIDRQRVQTAFVLGLIFALAQRGGVLLIDHLAGSRTPLAHGLKHGGYLLLGALGLSLATTLWSHHGEGRPLR